MRVLLTGACGYVGSVLLPKLLAKGHYVEAIDVQWFGNHTGMVIDKADFRTFPIKNIDAVIHLAAVANDPTGDLDPKLTWEVNALGTAQLCAEAAKAGVKQFIYASSGSVYGISNLPQVTEDAPLVPVSEYNKTKAVAERVVLSYADQMAVQILRPATVCGYSPRMRLDVVVNTLTMQALKDGVVSVLGGNQFRPNIHIDDMTDLYMFMLERPELTGIYNAGFENRRVSEIARMISERIDTAVMTKASKDPRSYRMNSDKLLATGFKPAKSVKVAVAEMQAKFREGKLDDLDEWYNLRGMRYAGVA